jgi:hypothetical protein
MTPRLEIDNLAPPRHASPMSPRCLFHRCVTIQPLLLLAIGGAVGFHESVEIEMGFRNKADAGNGTWDTDPGLQLVPHAAGTRGVLFKYEHVE